MTEKTERYQILEEIGRGGFAVVYRAHDTQLDRLVALKELHSHLLGDAGWVERFRREARLIARLNHPHIVAIHDIGQASGRQFLIMSLVEGPGLDKLLAGRGRLPWTEALEIIRAVADGLDYAHSQHILHRDLKPANILMDPARGPLLSDFGLAKLVSDHSLSQSGSIVGTPHYIPPEIWDGEPATPQADIYALGCILYELLTGERLFGGNTPPAIMMAHFRPLLLPTDWPEGVPPEAVEVLNVALAKQPKQRYTTAREMVKAILNLSGFENLSGLALSPAPSPPSPPAFHIDWGEAPDVTTFYGRQAEATQLQQWLVEDNCRLVAVLGMGGLGKTSLVTHLAEEIKEKFAYVIWRSLRNAPPLDEILADWILFLSDQQTYHLPNEMDKRISLLIGYLRQKRCLLVLDNAESILQAGARAGHYRQDYEGYGQLLQRVGESRHQSCLILTSREKPGEFAPLEGDRSPVRSLQLSNIDPVAGRAILQDRGLSGPDESWRALLDRYSGNPLALKLVAETVRELFFGEITAFLTEETTIFGGVRDLLTQHFDRLSELEQEVLVWLAIEREPVGPDHLWADLVRSVSRRELLETLRNLQRRSLLEQADQAFTLQNVVLEFLTDYLVESLAQEIQNLSLNEGKGPKVEIQNLNRFALIKAQAKEYVRASQSRLLAQPILERLLARYGPTRTEAHLKQTCQVLKTFEVSPPSPGYAAGNLLNLLLSLKPEVSDLDLSGLSVWQAYLQGMRVQNVNLSQADLSGSVFTDTFGSVFSVAFSPDGRLLAAGTSDGQVRVWRTSDGQPFLTCEGHTSTVWSVCFSPDGQNIASGSSDHSVRLWDVRTGQGVKVLSGHTDEAGSVCFSPDGQTIASGSEDFTVRLWDVRTGQGVKVLSGHTDEVNAVCFSPDGRTLASGSDDHTIRLWDVANINALDAGQCFKTLEGHTSAIRSLCFSPDGQTLVSGSHDHTIRLWDVANINALDAGQCFKTLEGHTGGVLSLCFSSDGQTLVSGSFDQTIRLWDMGTGQCLNILSGYTDAVMSICLSPDGQLLASGSLDRTIRLWDIRTGQCLKILEGHITHVRSVSFSPDGQSLASASYDQIIRLWNVGTGQCLKTLLGHTSWILSVSFSPDGQTLVSGSFDQTVRLWDVRTGQGVKVLSGHTDEVNSVCFSPDGQTLASGSYDQTVRLWDVANVKALDTGQCLKTLSGHTSWVMSVTFSPDGQTLVSGSADQTIRLWDVAIPAALETGQCLKILEGHTSPVFSVCFSPDGQSIASGSEDRTIRLWDVANVQTLDAGQSFKILEGHTSAIRSLCFSPDGQSLVSSSADQTIRLWEVGTGHCFKILKGHTSAVRSVCFSPDGQSLASGSNDETIKLWDVKTGACLKTLRLPGPYQGMNIAGAVGLSEAQQATLKALGAISDEP